MWITLNFTTKFRSRCCPYVLLQRNKLESLEMDIIYQEIMHYYATINFYISINMLSE